MKHSTPRTILTLALPLAIAGGCGDPEAPSAELRDPSTQEVIGYYDGEQQAYVFDTDTVPVWQIDTTYVSPDSDADPSDPGAPLTAPSNPRNSDDLLPEPGLSLIDGERCWEVTTSADGDAVLCRGCCTADACREVCSDLREVKAATAMHEWRDLDVPAPRPPQ